VIVTFIADLTHYRVAQGIRANFARSRPTRIQKRPKNTLRSTLQTHPFSMGQPLSPDARRLRTIIISAPLLVVTSCMFRFVYGDVGEKLKAFMLDVLYKRLMLGESQRKLKRDPHVDIEGRVGRELISIHTSRDGPNSGANPTGGK
jgi:hypothetical protein